MPCYAMHLLCHAMAWHAMQSKLTLSQHTLICGALLGGPWQSRADIFEAPSSQWSFPSVKHGGPSQWSPEHLVGHQSFGFRG